MRVMIPLANGFEDIEAMTVVDVLRRAGIFVDTVGVTGSMIRSKHGVRVMTDKRLLEVKAEDYDAIVIPGGSPGYEILGRCTPLIEMIKKLDSQNKTVAAICGAVSILANNGLLDNRKATIYPGMEKLLEYPRDKPVVVDNNVITSQGPGTAMEFALGLVKKLKGEREALKLRRELVV